MSKRKNLPNRLRFEFAMAVAIALILVLPLLAFGCGWWAGDRYDLPAVRLVATPAEYAR